MKLWILITIVASFLQNVRSSMQKHLKGVMGTTGATFVRFGFGVPFALVFLGLLHYVGGEALPRPTASFFGWALLGGATQIAAQALMVHLFSFRNFAVGTAYSRTEPAQAALFGLLFLGETVTAGTLVAIAISVVGVMLISVARTPFTWGAILRAMTARTAVIGIASGTCFGIAAVSYRAASLALAPTLAVPNFVAQAAMTLGVVIVGQTIAMSIWMLVRQPEEIGNIVRAWRPSLVVGLSGACASFGWFMAMTLQQAAYVKALAQIEMLLALATAAFVFREKINRTEVAGCALIVIGVVALVMAL